MPDTLPTAVLEPQHRQINRGFEALLEADDGAGLSACLALLRRHLYAEEAILFPALEKAGQGGPLFVMRREHGLMWPLLEALEAACAARAEPASLAESARRLYQLLRMHNPKEEQFVYAAADRLAADPAHAGLGTELEAADPPQGWTCAMAPRGGPAPAA